MVERREGVHACVDLADFLLRRRGVRLLNDRDHLVIDTTASSPDDAAIVRAIISLAHGLRLKVVAEGVESAVQLDMLKSMGCDQYQGFYFSRALEPAQFVDFVKQSSVGKHFADEELARTQSKLTRLKVA